MGVPGHGIGEPTKRPTRKPRSRRRRWTRFVLPVYTAGAITYLMLPIFVMILFGFNNTGGKLNLKWQGFTFQWYRQLTEIPDLTAALKNSLLIGFTSTIIATALGTMIALALGRYRFRGSGPVNLVLFMNIAAPEVALGAALLTLFILMGLSRGFLTILIAHVMFNIAYVTVTVRARLAGFERDLEEAAQDLGANPWIAFWKVTFPLIFPAILAGGLLAFALSIDDYVITTFVAGQTVTFPLWVFGASRVGIPPQVNVMGTLLFLAGVTLAVGNLFLQRRAGRAARIDVLFGARAQEAESA